MRDPSLRALRVLGLSAVLRPNYPYTVLRPVPTLSSPLRGAASVSLALARVREILVTLRARAVSSETQKICAFCVARFARAMSGQGAPQRRRDLSTAVARGDADAQFALGWMHTRGQGGPQDFAEARRLWGLAAAQGHAGAQYSLGRMHHRGEG